MKGDTSGLVTTTPPLAVPASADDDTEMTTLTELDKAERLFAINARSREEASICVLQGFVMGREGSHPATILIDSGSSQSYISESFVRQISLPTEQNGETPYWVQVADGRYREASQTVHCGLQLGTYQMNLDARVLYLPSYDVILGRDWLTSVNPVIDFQDHSMEIQDPQGRIHELRPENTQHYISTPETTCLVEDVYPISWSQTEKYLRQPGTTAALFVIRKETDQVWNAEAMTDHPMKPAPKSAELDESLQKLTIGDEKIRSLISQFKDVFRSELPPELPPTRDHEHEIDTGEAAPININAYPLTPSHLEEQSRQVQQMLEQGIISESASPWGFPVLFVKKAEGTWRMCIDYRALNAVTKKNGYPLPRIQQCLDLIGHAKYLSKLDLTQGYYQVQVAPKDREKTAFNTIHGKFQFNAMPFGLANAPATFQTMMNRVLRKGLGRYIIVYLDDIVIFSRNRDEHQQHLTEVLELLRTHRLFAKPSKCLIAVPELEFCGHLVGQGLIQPLQSKVKEILDWPIPTNIHEVRQFLGLATYYRKYIPGFAKHLVPLFNLLKESDAEIRKKRFRKIVWTANCQLAFDEVKRLLTTKPVHAQPDTTRSFVIETDASEYAIGCVLSQANITTGKLHPVAYDGRKLTPAEINYPVHEKELLAVKYALQTWRIYIDNGTRTTIFTDHESLKYMHTMQKPTKRLARWIEEFGEYDLDLRYRPGTQQVVPDAISRRPDWMGVEPRHLASKLYSIRGMDEDEWASHMYAWLMDRTPPPSFCMKDIYGKQHKFTPIDDKLYYKEDEETRSPYIPVIFRADLIEELHRGYGHLGYPGILGIVKTRGWWHDRVKDLQNFVRMCPECQIAQRSQPNLEREFPQTLTKANLQLFDRWAIDLIGILPCTPGKNRWIVTAIEYLTGWPIAKALPNARAETIAQFIHDEITVVYGAPKEILSDNGPNLTSKVMQAYTNLLKARHRFTTPYHPRTNGKVENFNGFLGATLTRLLTNKPVILWDQYLPQALFAVRVRIHSRSKQSPYSLLFGKEPRLPTDDNAIRPMATTDDDFSALLERVQRLQHARLQANEALVQEALRAQKIRTYNVSQESFKVGDWVLVRAESRNKFEGRWFGPYKIRRALLLGTYQLQAPDGQVVKLLINGQRLIPANVNDETQKRLWNSSKIQGSIQRAKVRIDEPSPEVAKMFEEDNDTPTYDELATIPIDPYELERSGHRPDQVGEGTSQEEVSEVHEAIRSALEEADIANAEQGLNERASTELSNPLTDSYEPILLPPTPVEDPQTGIDDVEFLLNDEDIIDEPTEGYENPPKETKTNVDEDEEMVDLPPPTRRHYEKEIQAATRDRLREDTNYGLRSRPKKREWIS